MRFYCVTYIYICIEIALTWIEFPRHFKSIQFKRKLNGMFTDVIQSQRLYLQCINKKKVEKKVLVVNLEFSLKKL